ncbi:hypothetical protein [Motilibacter aurantiacus]|nr:hypothetical protein [Motilibacter aurantiacus]
MLLVACSAAFYLASRRSPVNPANVNDEWTGTVAPERARVPANA